MFCLYFNEVKYELFVGIQYILTISIQSFILRVKDRVVDKINRFNTGEFILLIGVRN